MKNYRAGFLAALAGNILLIGVVAVVWWHSRTSMPRPSTASRTDSAAMSGPMADSASAPPEDAEVPRAPMQLTPERLQSIGVKTGEVQQKRVEDEIRTTGNVVVDETRVAYVQVRFSGYIQKVFVDATYRYVRKGQPLFTIYSPDLVAAEHEYLAAKESQRRMAHSTDSSVIADAASLVEAATARLKQWDIPEREIARLESTGQVQQDLEIDSPVSGYVTQREALPNKYAQPDTRLYTVADLSRIWVFAQVFQNDLRRLVVGGSATLSVDAYPGREFGGRVDFVYPDIDMSTRTARVRLVFANPGLKLTPGMFVNVALKTPMGEQLVIPATGVLQSGIRAMAFVDQGGGSLEPREVQLGARVGDDFIVLKGLKAGEKIITSANFLIDSESQLQAALGTFVPPPAGAGATGGMRAAQADVELISDPSPPAKGGNVFRVRVTDSSGAPVAQAQVTATFFMAAMPAMGMAAMHVPVTFSDKGNGLYEGSGKLGSGGTWQVTIVARKNGQVVASKQLSVSATGGM
jgi:Cu(I)/Ag(I) efflux system membrane fusion protein/cobalt-zinc-cadmium efflux system membrane fusion protein